MSIDFLIYNKLSAPHNRLLSVSNSNADGLLISSGGQFTGGSDRSDYSGLAFSGYSSGTCNFIIQFSHNNINWDSALTYSVVGNFNEVHRLVNTKSYFRVIIVNTAGVDITIRFETFKGEFGILSSPLNSNVTSDADSIITRSVLMGQTDGGQFAYVPVTQEGHLEVAIHDPVLPFGSMHTESLTPVYQFDAVYGLNAGLVDTTITGSGSVNNNDGMFTVSSGGSIYSSSVIQGRKRLRYRAGQGVVARFTTLFSPPVSQSYQLVGVGHSECGVYVGYGNTNDLNDLSFGVLHVNGGKREIKTLTVSTGATSAGNVTVTLNGTAYVVAVTNNASTLRTAYEISRGTYAGWDAYPTGSTVVFIKNSSGTTLGTQSVSAGTTGVVASIVQTRVGVPSTDVFYPQSAWNGDKLDGSGASGITIDPTKLNIWQLGIGYLGTDALVIKAKITPPNSNNSIWVTCNTIKFTNSRTTPIFSNPAFPFTMAVYSAGSTTNLITKCASAAGFIEGQKVLQGNRFTYFNQLNGTVGPTNLQALFTIMNTRVYSSVANQSVVNILNASGAIKHNSPVVFYLIRNGTLNGTPNFQALSNISCTVYDTAASTVTYSTGDQLLATFHVGDTGEFDHKFSNGEYNAEEITLQPGEWITLAAKSTTANPSYVTGSINTREDQ